MPEARFYGASRAALSVGTAPAEYRERADVKERIAALTGYLERERANQPLHNRLALVWASSKLPAALPAPLRKAILDEILRVQQPDRGWTIAALGPWNPNPKH